MTREVHLHCPKCGQRSAISLPPADKRSGREHRTFFGVVEAAWNNWPESHSFKPETPEHLRAWLLIEVGHADEMHYPDVDPNDLQGLAHLARFIGGHRHFRVRRSGKEGVVFLMARSLSEQTLEDREEFHQISQSVYMVVKAITGIDVDAYVRNGPHGANDPGPQHNGASA